MAGRAPGVQGPGTRGGGRWLGEAGRAPGVDGPGTRGEAGRGPGAGGHPRPVGRAPGASWGAGHPGCPRATALSSPRSSLLSLAPWVLETPSSPSHDHLFGILECITCLREVEPNSHVNSDETRRGESQPRSQWHVHVLLSLVHSVLAVEMMRSIPRSSSCTLRLLPKPQGYIR